MHGRLIRTALTSSAPRTHFRCTENNLSPARLEDNSRIHGIADPRTTLFSPCRLRNDNGGDGKPAAHNATHEIDESTTRRVYSLHFLLIFNKCQPHLHGPTDSQSLWRKQEAHLHCFGRTSRRGRGGKKPGAVH